jgi:hypothetical protein
MTVVFNETLTETLTSGLTTECLSERESLRLRVTWIAWDSGFRNTGLRVGDEIIAIQGEALMPFADSQEAQKKRGALIGQYQEAMHWSLIGAQDAHSVRLTVRRRKLPGDGWQVFEIVGTLRLERMYYNDQGRKGVGPNGPEQNERDDFDDAWVAFLEKRKSVWERLLGDRAWATQQDNRRLLQNHMQDEQRVHFMAERYPGSFADAFMDDYRALHELLAGRRYELSEEDFAYREEEAKRVALVTGEADIAWRAMKKQHETEILDVPENFDPFQRKVDEVAGTLVVLPPAKEDEWVEDFGLIHASWNVNGTWLFCPLNAPALGRAWDAQARYKRNVVPTMKDTMEMAARLLPEQKLISIRGTGAVCGIGIEPIAVLLGDDDRRIFVDLSVEREGVSEFAGEASIRAMPSDLPPDDASPRQVMEALIVALYARDIKTWSALFADWRYVGADPFPFYYPYCTYPEFSLGNDWEQSRRTVLERSYAIRVVWAGDPEVIAEEGTLPGLPRIERVQVELEHVGLFDGEYRAFNSVYVHRHWTLERRGGGPWRITTYQGI